MIAGVVKMLKIDSDLDSRCFWLGYVQRAHNLLLEYIVGLILLPIGIASTKISFFGRNVTFSNMGERVTSQPFSRTCMYSTVQ